MLVSVSYSSRNKYLLTNDKIYSNVIQETQAEAALVEVAEETFRDHLSETDQTKTRGDLRDIDKDGQTSATNKVVPFGQLNGPQKQKPNTDFFLGLINGKSIVDLHKRIFFQADFGWFFVIKMRFERKDKNNPDRCYITESNTGRDKM